MSSSTTFRISDILPNPFRRLDGYPLQESKITALRESIRSTGFWDNVVARIGPDGRPQLAYGHHRLEALKQEFASYGNGADEVTLIIRDLDDEMMLRMMVRENMEDWSCDARMDQASVRAVVEAYAEGKVTLPPPEPKTPKATLRHAPSFVQGHVPGDDREDRPYTAATLMGMLGWNRTKVEDTLKALELIESAGLNEDVYDDLTPSDARFLTQQVARCVTTNTAWITAAEDEARKWREAISQETNEDKRALCERWATLAEGRLEDVRGSGRANFVAMRARWALKDGDGKEERKAALVDKLLVVREGPTVPSRLTIGRPTWGEYGGNAEMEKYINESVTRFCAELDCLRSVASQFTPEEMREAMDAGDVVRGALDALDTALRAEIRERQERGSAPQKAPEPELVAVE